MLSGVIVCCDARQRQQATAPGQPQDREGKHRHSTMYSVATIWGVLCFVVCIPSWLQNAHLCLLLMVNETRKAIIIEVKRRIIAQR